MQDEWSIHCHECGHTRAEGGLDCAVSLSEQEVLAQAGHNPGCFVQAGKRLPVISHEEVQEHAITIAVYRIIGVPIVEAVAAEEAA